MNKRELEFDNQRDVFLSYVHQEQEILTQAKQVLEEVAVKLDEERKLISKSQSKIHYDREALLLEKKTIRLTKTYSE